MRREKEQSNSTPYTTLDAYQAGFLTLRHHTPRLVTQGIKIVFTFHVDNTLYQDLADYNAGATVSAIQFTLAIKNLKSKIFALKMNK